MTDLFVERRYSLEPGDEVVAIFFAPERRDGYFHCDYVLTWPDREKRFHGAGVDGVQALLHAIMQVEVTLVVSPEYKTGRLTWLGMSHLGLPSTATFKTAID